MDSVMMGLIRAMPPPPPQNFWARTAPGHQDLLDDFDIVKVIREFVSFDDSLTLVFGHVKTMTKFIRVKLLKWITLYIA